MKMSLMKMSLMKISLMMAMAERLNGGTRRDYCCERGWVCCSSTHGVDRGLKDGGDLKLAGMPNDVMTQLLLKPNAYLFQ